MVDPKNMCRKHLLGEHVECHMFVGTIRRGKSVHGYLEKGLLEMHNLQNRHDELVVEMERRGYKHNSPMSFTAAQKGKIDSKRNLILLHERCEVCRRSGR
jgi:hypothetical protein